MAEVPIYVLAGQSNAKRNEVYESVRSALADLGGPSVVLHAGSTAAGLVPLDGVPDWSPSSPSDLFAAMMTQIWTAAAEIVAAGDTPVAGGFFWVQGEEDARDAETAAAYKDNLENFIATLRSDFGDEFPFVVTEIRTTADPWPYHETVRQAQHDTANGTNVLLLETDNFALSPDNVHYSIVGRHALGQALVDQVEARHLEIVGQGDATPRILTGTTESDEIIGGLGNDRIRSGAGRDSVFGGAGDDVLLGGNGADRLYGGDGTDRLYAGYGKDFLAGGDGNDRLFGRVGNDVLVGGEGRDRFFFLEKDGPESHDTILDFEIGSDQLVMRGITVTDVEATTEGALVHFNSGATVLLEGIDADALTGKSFVYQEVVA